MRKRKLQIVMLAILVLQSFGSAASAFAITSDYVEEPSQSKQLADTTTDGDSRNKESRDILNEQIDNNDVNKPDEDKVENESVIGKSTNNQIQVTDSSILETVQGTRTKNSILPTTIEDEILTSMTVTNMEGVEYSQSTLNRVLNTTPVTSKISFVIEDKDYAPGSQYTVALPEHLGYSDVSGDVANVGAKWSVDAQNRKLTITFNQRITDAEFNLDLKSYVYTNSNPLVTIETPGQTKNLYNFDLYEEVLPIKYEETKSNYGVSGNLYYNLDRGLSGSQTVELLMSDVPGATFSNASKQPIVAFSYDVNIHGDVIPESKQLLEKDKDYTINEDSVYRGAVTFTNMDQQKAYAVSIDRALALESVLNYDYSFYNQYPTTKLGSVSLNRSTAPYGGLEFTAKTSKDHTSVKEVRVGTLTSANFQEKGDYYVYIYNIPTQTKIGEQIILESTNGQAIDEYKFSAYTGEYQEAKITDFFDIRKDKNKLILTAIKESVLQLRADKITIPFEQKDINISISTPVVSSGKAMMMVSDQYLQTVSIVNPNNVETAWGNYDQNGAYFGRTTVAIEGSTQKPAKNVAIKIEHPSYLQLRAPKGEYSYYKLNKDYTITAIEGGSLIKFTTPVTHSFNLPLGFNYVPDGLEKSKSIPIDTLLVTLSADDYETVETTVKTGSKSYSERTLQASKNQFLVNARNDSFDSLSVLTKVPAGTDVVFDIYDVSNDQVESIYPQYWDRGYYFDKPLASNDPAYPKITTNETDNTYRFDFGKTSKRYIIEYKYANGWIDTKKINVTGSTAEPLYDNQVISAAISVNNEGTEILSAQQTSYDSLKNVTKNELKTTNINNRTRKVKNPTFDITIKGTTNAGIDLNSIDIPGIPQDVYTIKQTEKGMQIVFKDYTLTENITITYNTVSKNAGQIFTETIITADNLEQMSESRRTTVTSSTVLRFSDGEAEGVVYLAQAQFHTYNETDKAINVPDVHFELVDNVTNNRTEFDTNDEGYYKLDSIMSGEYTLKATDIPVGYTLAEEYLDGKVIKLTKGTNSIDIPLTEKNDQTSISAKNSTIYVGTNWKPEDNFTGATDKEGNAVSFDQISVTGSVDTSKVGEYDITYHNQGKEITVIVYVVSNQETLVVKDSTLYVGDPWQASDNILSATDETGKSISVEVMTVSGSVDTTKAGVYDVTYSYYELKETAKITVLPNQATVSGKDSTISVGTNWSAEDNFIAATDRDGKTVEFDQVTVIGTVDTATVGDYEVTYQNQGKEAKVVVHVVAKQETIAVKDSTIYVGDPWQAADNFLSATNDNGENVPIEKVTVNGTVDTTKSGIYEVVYGFGNQKEIAKITVKEDQSTLVVKDSTIYVGDNWDAKNNFISATDRAGNIISFEKVKVTGTVETKEKGTYQVSYKTQATQKPEPRKNKLSLTNAASQNERQQTATANITVLERKSPKSNETNKNQTHLVKTDKPGSYPKTGEKPSGYFTLIGFLILSATLIGVTMLKKRKPD
ncbi:bacterial Ig-like domain-containing protein [Enterococcus quebecensis]|uniref:Peptidase n=1 Tax=Enterococcus quebecensis TaxID=903983 RepID=A0A1E5GRG3_9ENTE|nr:bacterial Ig-like domain-containing protein [Enterococcus quebecensis]OEG15304.1 peptidase [Enterococcus quebecensis]OJG72266.1 LPXTG-domain-containing protein cell wall anchor domain [Enterococcus quebecensis]